MPPKPKRKAALGGEAARRAIDSDDDSDFQPSPPAEKKRRSSASGNRKGPPPGRECAEPDCTKYKAANCDGYCAGCYKEIEKMKAEEEDEEEANIKSLQYDNEGGEKSAPKPLPAAAVYHRGSRVMAYYRSSKNAYPAIIVGDKEDGKYHVRYDDGDEEKKSPGRIRPMTDQEICIHGVQQQQKPAAKPTAPKPALDGSGGGGNGMEKRPVVTPPADAPPAGAPPADAPPALAPSSGKAPALAPSTGGAPQGKTRAIVAPTARRMFEARDADDEPRSYTVSEYLGQVFIGNSNWVIFPEGSTVLLDPPVGELVVQGRPAFANYVSGDVLQNRNPTVEEIEQDRCLGKDGAPMQSNTSTVMRNDAATQTDGPVFASMQNNGAFVSVQRTNNDAFASMQNGGFASMQNVPMQNGWMQNGANVMQNGVVQNGWMQNGASMQNASMPNNAFASMQIGGNHASVAGNSHAFANGFGNANFVPANNRRSFLEHFCVIQ